MYSRRDWSPSRSSGSTRRSELTAKPEWTQLRRSSALPGVIFPSFSIIPSVLWRNISSREGAAPLLDRPAVEFVHLPHEAHDLPAAGVVVGGRLVGEVGGVAQ